MFDQLTKKMLETAFSSYMPRIQELAQRRTEELKDIKSRIRTEPEKVEEWFDEEVRKAHNISPDAFFDEFSDKNTHNNNTMRPEKP